MISIEHEFESRSMLSEEKYFEIASDFYRYNQNLQTIVQRNQYFDDENLFLTKNEMVLRIRITKKEAVLTLKIGQKDGHSKEYKQKISYFQHKALVEKSHFPKGTIKLTLMSLGIPLLSLKFICEMKTKRSQINIKDYNFCVDENEYRGIKDYNIEVEATSMEKSREILEKLSKQYNFEITKDYVTKAKRALLMDKKE
ncbi:MAG: CYTH domain-containing protein [Bacilli bacterium]|nr:CYTH domain-containing protein [Bacilli bacterium]